MSEYLRDIIRVARNHSLGDSLKEILVPAPTVPPDPKWCVIVGDPVNGIQIHGPFNTEGVGLTWAEEYHQGEAYWVVPMGVP